MKDGPDNRIPACLRDPTETPTDTHRHTHVHMRYLLTLCPFYDFELKRNEFKGDEKCTVLEIWFSLRRS